MTSLSAPLTKTTGGRPPKFTISGSTPSHVRCHPTRALLECDRDSWIIADNVLRFIEAERRGGDSAPRTRVRHLRRLRSPERGRAHLLRAFRAATSRPGKRRDRYDERRRLHVPDASRH